PCRPADLGERDHRAGPRTGDDLRDGRDRGIRDDMASARPTDRDRPDRLCRAGGRVVVRDTPQGAALPDRDRAYDRLVHRVARRLGRGLDGDPKVTTAGSDGAGSSACHDGTLTGEVISRYTPPSVLRPPREVPPTPNSQPAHRPFRR